MVRTNTIAGPGSDAAVVRVKETDTSIAMSLDGNGRYCYLDPREGAKLAVAECCRNLATTGALPVAATNNLNFGNPERPEIMAQLVEAIEGIAEACAFFETPITGGNVSLYNETLGEGIYPTPVLGIIGLMKTAIPRPCSSKAKARDRSPGRLRPNRRPCASAAANTPRSSSTSSGDCRRSSTWITKSAFTTAMREILAQGLAESAHDLSDGGLPWR
jgi:phosphoribosylformylglycinamidine synthase subunit PurL